MPPPLPILVIPEKTDVEFEKIVTCWTQRGGEIKRLGKYWIRDAALEKNKIAIYGNQTFSLVLEQMYGLTLISPNEKFIAELEWQWIKRTITMIELEKIAQIEFPVFIKPVIPKLFTAKIYDSINALNESIKGLATQEEILVSSVIEKIKAEARGYIKNGTVYDLALYEGAADLIAGYQFLQAFASEHLNELPRVVVVDIGYSAGTGWFVIELNACWGAGLNNCDPEKVIDCIVEATVNPSTT
jgi:hypothetical protein